MLCVVCRLYVFGVCDCVACDVDCLALLPPTFHALKPGQVQGGDDDIRQSYCMY